MEEQPQGLLRCRPVQSTKTKDAEGKQLELPAWPTVTP